MKKIFALIAVVVVMVLFGGSVRAADQFEGLQIVPPDSSVSPDIRALYGKSGKWGKKGGWDGIWHADISVSRAAGSKITDEPGILAVVQLTNEKAKLHFTYGKQTYDCEAKVFTHDQNGICMQTDEKSAPPSDRAGEPPIFCLKDGKITGKWQGYYTLRTIPLSQLE
jgi:hypothetical protein